MTQRDNKQSRLIAVLPLNKFYHEYRFLRKDERIGEILIKRVRICSQTSLTRTQRGHLEKM